MDNNLIYYGLAVAVPSVVMLSILGKGLLKKAYLVKIDKENVEGIKKLTKKIILENRKIDIVSSDLEKFIDDEMINMIKEKKGKLKISLLTNIFPKNEAISELAYGKKINLYSSKEKLPSYMLTGGGFDCIADKEEFFEEIKDLKQYGLVTEEKIYCFINNLFETAVINKKIKNLKRQSEIYKSS